MLRFSFFLKLYFNFISTNLYVVLPGSIHKSVAITDMAFIKGSCEYVILLTESLDPFLAQCWSY